MNEVNDFWKQGTLMATCWTCAKKYNSKEASSPTHYCSGECADFGARPYNRRPSEDKIKLFAIELIDRFHYLLHDDNDRLDCDNDWCFKAKILGL